MNYFIKFAGFMRKVLLFFISLILLVSCKDSYNYVARKGTVAQKYEYAKKYFDKKKYSKSQPLLEEIYPQYKGKKEAEDIYYMLAYSHYKLHDYLLASYHFDNFTQQYSLSSRVEECAFMHCICEFYKLPQKDEFEYLIVKSHYLYAKNSILSVQLDRYKKAIEASNEFYAEHSQSHSIYSNDIKSLVILINTGIAKVEREIKRKPIAPTKTT